PQCKSTSLTENILLKNVVLQRIVDNIELDCPYVLAGCSAKVPRCDLENHKQLCPYSTAKLADKQQQKLQKSIALLTQYTETAIPVSDSDLYDLTKALHEQFAYAKARKCFGKMKTKNSSLEIVILQGHIERDDGKYTDALRLYDQAYDMTTSPSQRIELLLAKGRMFIKIAKYIEAKDAFNHALDILHSNNQSQTQKKAEILNSIGLVAKKRSDYDHALRAYNEALSLVSTDSNLRP
ncbi:unnamed protein product, partial [Rotaria sordida]